MINTWDLWVKEWENASKFFNTKGNIKTKSKLKDKWYKEFIQMLKDVEVAVSNEKKVRKNDKNIENISKKGLQ